METTLFYLFATVTVLATLLAICARHPVHAIIHLVTSFFALAVIFYLLAAPLVAMFEVLIYAGAVMVLFMFVIMMLSLGGDSDKRPGPRLWLPAGLLGATMLASLLSLAATTASPLAGGVISAREFSRTLFGRYGIAVEIISLQLLFAVVGALYLGRPRQRGTATRTGEGAP